ncbi:MAG: secretin N-terminal domain-containing protein [Rhodothalassiaceae bacterium]
MLFSLASCVGAPPPDLQVEQNTLRTKIDRDPAEVRETETLTDAPEPEEPLGLVREQRLKSDQIPDFSKRAQAAYEKGKPPPKPGDRLVDTTIPPLALPAFIDLVFGQILELPYITGPEVAKRNDVIQLRSSGNVPADDFLSLISKTLEAYGVRVSGEDGIYRIVQEESIRDLRPRFFRSRSRPSTPMSLRPVVQFIQMRAVSPASMQRLLRRTFPRNARVEATPDLETGSLILVGLPDEVDAAIEVIETLDVPAFAGTEVIQYSPIFWQVADLSQQLSAILTAEGWQVSLQPQEAATVLLVPVPFTNDLIAFVKNEEAYVRVAHWLETLDKPAQVSGNSDQIFVYTVRNTDATIVANTANQVLARTAFAPPADQVPPPAAVPAGQQAGRAVQNGALVVDPQGNRLIFSGSPSQYERLLPLLRRLDTPTPEVLIEVTIVEVMLDESTNLDLNIAASTGADGNFDLQDAVLNAAANGGLVFGVNAGDVVADLAALASNNQVEILSTPRVVARSGGAANIQIGDDVPVVSSQAPTDFQADGGASAVLQQVGFRSTGVLLSIEPIVYSNGRVDLTLTQEVSSSSENTLTEVANPIISNTNLTTQLTLEDGATAVLGGLIQDNIDQNITGVPFLKDIPFFGRLFRDESISRSRQEVLLIITAYIIQNSEDRQKFVDYLVGEINGTLADQNRFRTLRTRSLN